MLHYHVLRFPPVLINSSLYIYQGVLFAAKPPPPAAEDWPEAPDPHSRLDASFCSISFLEMRWYPSAAWANDGQQEAHHTDSVQQ